FTLPAELRPLVFEHEVVLLDLLFAAASDTILELAADPKRLGATLGITAVVHTWGRNLSFHPHLHCIVTGGGLASDGTWIQSRAQYLLPVKVMGRLFQGKFLAGLARFVQQGKIALGPRTSRAVADLLSPLGFARLKACLHAKSWNVYAKAPFRNGGALFRYLGQYTHRVAISNHRLLDVTEHEVAFRTRGDGICRLEPLEFMRRFLQHVLPRGFVKIRHFGLYAAGNVNSKLATARECLEPRSPDRSVEQAAPAPLEPAWRALVLRLTGVDPAICTACGGSFISHEPHAVTSARAPPGPGPAR
ncbi:MAG TPA: transposase, partial [Polyangia bacterium]